MTAQEPGGSGGLRGAMQACLRLATLLDPRILACVRACVSCRTGSMTNNNHEKRGGSEGEGHVHHLMRVRRLLV